MKNKHQAFIIFLTSFMVLANANKIIPQEVSLKPYGIKAELLNTSIPGHK
ncbi:MAG: hypothetical protein IPJ23_00380 [Ignavibacteriales bacterium]|nr:hypothetical protein [Ignavibacteriales bacterium]